MRIPGWRRFLHFLLFSHPKLVTLKERSTKNVVPPRHTSNGFFLGRCLSVRMSQTTVRSRKVSILLSSSVVTTPYHRCSVANMAWDPLASVRRKLAVLGVLARGENCTKVHLARLIASVQKASRDVHDMFLASGSADVLGHEVSLASA